MTRLFIVRHGDTLWGDDDRLKGQLDVPLSALGRRQAAAAAAYLSRAGASVIYCSTLSRAQQTARPIADVLRCPLVTTPLLNERHWGIWQALTAEEVRRERVAGRGGPDHSAPLGEPWTHMAARVGWFMDLVARGRAEQTVIAVTHGGVVKNMVMPTIGVPERNRSAFTAATGSISLLQHAAHGWRPAFLNADPGWAAAHHPAAGA